MRQTLMNIAFRIALCLYVVAVGFHTFRYNNRFDTGLPGYLAALQLEWLGEADERMTVFGAVLLPLVPFFVVTAMARRVFDRSYVAAPNPLPDWPGKMLSNGVIVAILAVSAYLFLSDEEARTSTAKIDRLDLNSAESLPENAAFVAAAGRLQGDHLYVLESKKSGQIESATVYTPFTATGWTPDRPVTYIAALHYRYFYERGNGNRRAYAIDDGAAEATAARPFDAEVSAGGVPIAVVRAFAQEDHLKLADKVYLLEQTEFPDGKPRNSFDFAMPALPWLLPAGLPIGIAIAAAGAVALFWHWRRRMASVTTS